MKRVEDLKLIESLSERHGGVFSAVDLRTAFADPHSKGFQRRVDSLLTAGVLQRFCRGWYITETFDPSILSQRISPESFASLETRLGELGLIGPRSERRFVAVKTGRSRSYVHPRVTIEHLGIHPKLHFGWELDGVVRKASAERALLDALYFYQHGRALPVDPYRDIFLDRIDKGRLFELLERYGNPRFRSFVKGLVQ